MKQTRFSGRKLLMSSDNSIAALFNESEKVRFEKIGVYMDFLDMFGNCPRNLIFRRVNIQKTHLL